MCRIWGSLILDRLDTVKEMVRSPSKEWMLLPSTSTDTSNTAAPLSIRSEMVSSLLLVWLVMTTSTLPEADAPSVMLATARADRTTSPLRRSTTISLWLSAASAIPPTGRVTVVELVALMVMVEPSSAFFTALPIWEEVTEPPLGEILTLSPEPLTPLVPPEPPPIEPPPVDPPPELRTVTVHVAAALSWLSSPA